MKLALLVSGALSVLIVLFPGLVVAGYVLLLVPGLVLQWMPTVFLYLLATFLIGKMLPVANPLLAHAAAFAIAFMVASLAVQPLKWNAERAFTAARAQAIVPERKLSPGGDILFERIDTLGATFAPACDALCLALLDQPAVRSVTMAANGQRITYRLIDVDPGDAAAPASAQPYDPGMIASLLDLENAAATRESIASAWSERLSGTERLVKTATPERFEWRLTSRTQSPRADPAIFRAEIAGPGGEIVFRKGLVRHRIPTAPPYAQFSAGSAGTGFAPRGFSLSSREVVSRDAGFETAEKALAQAIALDALPGR